jgi:hypothetical protein
MKVREIYLYVILRTSERLKILNFVYGNEKYFKKMKIVKAILFCFLYFTVNAQEQYLSFKAGGTTGFTNLGNWKEYREIYNWDFDELLDTKLGKMNYTNGYQLGLEYIVDNDRGLMITLELLNERKMASTSAKFLDPSLGKRVFDVRYTTNTLTYYMGTKIDDFSAGVGMVLGFSQTNLSAYKRYEDGTISYGNENGSNGTYKAAGFITGLKLGFEYYMTDNIHFYTNILMAATLDLTSDTPLPTAGLAFPLIYVNKHFTFQVGTRFAVNW